MKEKREKKSLASGIITILVVLMIALVGVFTYLYIIYDITSFEEAAEFFEFAQYDEEKKNEKAINLNEIQDPIASIEQIENNGNTTVSNVEKYYYNQIDDNAKIIYNALEKNIENLKTGDYVIDLGQCYNELLNQENGSQILNQAYQVALDAFIMDRPDVFFLDTSKMILMIYSRKTVLKTTYTVTIKAEDNDTYYAKGFTSKEQVDEAVYQVEGTRNNLLAQLTGSNVKKIEQVHDCLIGSLEYDQSLSRINTRNIYGALVEREVVCEGYAKSFKYILDALGIPNMIVVGIGTNSSGQTESHAWNYVQIENKWYAIDVTWDDPIIVGEGKVPKKEQQKYLLKGSQMFNKNHQLTGKVSDNGMTFAYPDIEKEDYN